MKCSCCGKVMYIIHGKYMCMNHCIPDLSPKYRTKKTKEKEMSIMNPKCLVCEKDKDECVCKSESQLLYEHFIENSRPAVKCTNINKMYVSAYDLIRYEGCESSQMTITLFNNPTDELIKERKLVPFTGFKL